MLYYSRQFKRHMDNKRAGRMTAVPQLDIPEILVDNEDHKDEDETEQQQPQNLQRERSQREQQGQQQQQQQQQPAAATQRSRAKSSAATTAFDHDSGALLSPSTSRARSQHRSWAGLGGTDLSSFDTSYGHPLASPRTSRQQGEGQGGTSPGAHGHRSHASAFSFELAEPGAAGAGAGGGGGGVEEEEDAGTSLGTTRGGSSPVDPRVVRDMLDDSVWVESLRRSATMRKSGWGQGGFK